MPSRRVVSEIADEGRVKGALSDHRSAFGLAQMQVTGAFGTRELAGVVEVDQAARAAL